MSDNTELDPNDERVQALIKEALDKEVDGLKRKNEELILNNKRLKESAGTTNGVDVEEYEQLKREKSEREEAEAKKRGEFDKLLTQSREKAEKRELELTDRLTQAEKRYRDEVTRNAVLASINAEKADELLLMPHIMNRVKLTEEGGETRLEVLAPNGEAMLGEKGEAATLQDLHEEFKRHDVLAKCYPASVISGTGSRPNTGRGTTRNPFTKGDNWNLTEQMKLQRENPALAAQLEEAAKAA